MKPIQLISSLCFALLFISCEITEFGDEFQQNPNLLSPADADANFVLNNLQIEFSDIMQDLNRTTDEVMRYTNLNESYLDVAEPDALDGEFTNFYSIREDAIAIEAIAANDENFLFHRGASRIIIAYATVTIVDYLGDIPFFEANRAASEGIINPRVDDDEDIYQAMLTQIDDAIIDLNAGTPAPITDLFYGGDRDKWIRLANSLKLKMYVNMGNTSAINALLADDNFITAEDDFEFPYGNSPTDPDTRHPDFEDGYIPAPGDFIGNSFLDLLLNDKESPDPRTRYYVYRQTLSDPSDEILGGCPSAANFDFCYLGNGYYGRDHGDGRPRSADQDLRTTYGLYPVGGAFDDNSAVPTDETSNIGGAGILPVLLSSFVDFLRAEAAISLGTNDNAATLLESGIRKSMTKVLNFKSIAIGSPFSATQQDIDDYVTEVMEEFNTADAQRQLDIVLTEYYLASYGNSTEAYNGYRRTGYPSAFNAPVFNANVPFPRVFSMPRDEVINNANVDQRPITTQVFWDTNPPGFIN